MLVRRGVRLFHAVRVTDPVDPAAISKALPDTFVRDSYGLAEIRGAWTRCFARPGQTVVQCRSTGTLLVVDDETFGTRYEVVG